MLDIRSLSEAATARSAPWWQAWRSSRRATWQQTHNNDSHSNDMVIIMIVMIINNTTNSNHSNSSNDNNENHNDSSSRRATWRRWAWRCVRVRTNASISRAAAPRRASLRGWRNTVGNLIEIFWLKNAYDGPQFTGTCVKHRGVRFHRIRDFKQYYFNGIPPTPHSSAAEAK